MNPDTDRNKVGMNPDTFLYIRIYGTKESYKIYTGTTSNMERRQKEHDKGYCSTTKKLNKLPLLEIRYTKIKDRIYEKTFKKYNNKKKVLQSYKWDRWSG